jgi:serine/threonine protein kinase
MAPELLNTADTIYTEKVDIWAIGVLAYECLVGVSPFYDRDENKIIDNILQGRYVVPQSVSKEIEDFISITLQCDPKKRPTIQELIRHPVMTMEVPRKSLSY